MPLSSEVKWTWDKLLLTRSPCVGFAAGVCSRQYGDPH